MLSYLLGLSVAQDGRKEAPKAFIIIITIINNNNNILMGTTPPVILNTSS